MLLLVEIVGHVVHLVEIRNVREDNIKMDLREMGLEGMGCIHLAQDRDWWQALVNSVMNLRFHKRWRISVLTS
jgi:hypothetical protein